ncbi:MAG: hypothetical protein ACOCYT_05380 [Chloroflexota bacterium]
MFRRDFSFTKRQLGLLLLAVGMLALVVILSIDIIDAGREGGIGPAQRIALGGAAVLAFIGLTLIPLWDDPA